MRKKLIMACMAIAAFAAFVIAPGAQGAVLTSGGTALATGTSITGKNIGETEFNAGELTVKCPHAHIPGTLTANSSGTVAGEIAAGAPSFGGAGTNTDCTSPLGSTKVTVNSKLCLHVAKGTDVGTITGCGGVITFTLNVTELVTCTYQTATTGINGTITTGDARVVISNQAAAKDTGGFLCPNSGVLNMAFEFTLTGGGTLTFS